MPRRRWFDRTFELGLPLGALPDLVARLRGAPDRLEEALSALPGERLVTRQGGAWSMLEHAGHLADLEPLWIGRVEDLVGGRDRLRPADLENTATWDAQHNTRLLEAILRDFRNRRTDLVDRVASMGSVDVAATALHPRLDQPMSVVDLCFFVAEHDDHHLETISELRAAGGEAGRRGS